MFSVAVFLVVCIVCKMALADISTKALSTKRKYTQISIYKMLGIHSRNVCFVFVRGK